MARPVSMSDIVMPHSRMPAQRHTARMDTSEAVYVSIGRRTFGGYGSRAAQRCGQVSSI